MIAKRGLLTIKVVSIFDRFSLHWSQYESMITITDGYSF